MDLFGTLGDNRTPRPEDYDFDGPAAAMIMKVEGVNMTWMEAEAVR